MSKRRLLSLHEEALKQAESVEPRRWSLASGSLSSDSRLDNDRDASILISLQNTIIIPERNIPIEEILRFKERRRAELMALRHHLDDVFQKIRAAPDEQRAWIDEFEKLDAAVIDQVKVANEAGWRKFLKTFSLNIELGSVATALFTAGATYSKTGNIATSAIAGSAAALSVKVTSTIGQDKAASHPMGYILSMHREL